MPCVFKPRPIRLRMSAQRLVQQDRLQRVVNNARFLILPWIQSKGLASKILSKVARQLRLSPGAVRDLRKLATASRHLLQSSQLGARRADHRPRQEVRRPPPDHPDQGHLAVSAANGLRRRSLPIVRRVTRDDGFTECLPAFGGRRQAEGTDAASGSRIQEHDQLRRLCCAVYSRNEESFLPLYCACLKDASPSL